jgi:hypothetical protein
MHAIIDTTLTIFRPILLISALLYAMHALREGLHELIIIKKHIECDRKAHKLFKVGADVCVAIISFGPFVYVSCHIIELLGNHTV